MAPQGTHKGFFQAQGKALREAKERIALQEDVLSQKDRTIKSLQKQIQALETTGAGMKALYDLHSSSFWKQMKEISLQGQNMIYILKIMKMTFLNELLLSAGSTVAPTIEGDTRAKPTAREVHCSSSSTHKQGSPIKGSTRPHTGSNGIPNDAAAAASADEVAVLRRELQKSELTREVLQKTCNESVEKTVLLTLQHQQALQLQQIRQSQMNHHRPSECQPTLAGTALIRLLTRQLSNLYVLFTVSITSINCKK